MGKRLTPTKQIMVIAEAVGYKNLKHIDAPDCYIADGVWADNPKHPPHSIPRIKVPNYVEDFVAMKQAIKSLPPEKLDYRFEGNYWSVLSEVCHGDYARTADDHLERVIMSPTSKYAEAFIRTLGKWEEGK